MMKKLLYSGLAALSLGAALLFSNGQTRCAVNAYAEELPLNCKSAYCMDAESATPSYAMNEKARLPIASMCKIMTLILSFDAIESGKMNYDTIVPISEHAMSMGGSQVYLEAGGEYTAEQLLEGIVVCSANDACVALAEYISGSDDVFVQKMNERAKQLGCNDTLFANCTGLPKETQYSCAYDVAQMLKELIRHEKYFSFSKIWTDEFRHPEGRTTLITNTNKLIRQYSGCDGGKTGFTSQAGFCLAATAKRGDTRLISVCIGAPTGKDRFNAISSLFDYTFANYSSKEVIPATPLTEKATIANAKQREVGIAPAHPVRQFCKNGEENGAFTYALQFFPIAAPFEAGTTLGEMTVFKDGVEYAKVPLVSLEGAQKATLWDYFTDVSRHWVA